ncbi:Rieske (2Fe-2S) protein [Pseudomonas sp. N-137]|uniref:Rieske (2Fe-2S) protein n=1 Tax=Pseudomonas sp. N-137 TaxID=3108452 RepID=UPI002ADEF333|nr:Rieske (2Fe-2S) protein [Pseudomonas sp. N-137]MEA1029843.1 Rieske (2Fe-2S) protein [Pseudomonas sp. N-137]
MKFLCTGAELPDNSSRGFDLDGRKLLAVRRAGQVYVYLNRCPHRGVPLEWRPDEFLDPSASLIQCATHGALFLIESGECVAGPCAGQFLAALESREDEQGIWVEQHR